MVTTLLNCHSNTCFISAYKKVRYATHCGEYKSIMSSDNNIAQTQTAGSGNIKSNTAVTKIDYITGGTLFAVEAHENCSTSIPFLPRDDMPVRYLL